MSKLALQSKAQTLENIRDVLVYAEVLPQIKFSVSQYFEDKNLIVQDIQQNFCNEVIVRSSSKYEDNEITSNAGKFESVLNVPVDSSEVLCTAIEKVISSYSQIDEADEVFVQPMLQNVEMSGVIFSADMDTLSPYFIVNYDESGSTINVTGGYSGDLKTFVSFQENNIFGDQRLRKLIQAAKECQNIFGNEHLDIEFAYADEKVYIFQVRSLVLSGKDDFSDIDLSVSLRKLYKKIDKLNRPHPNLLGKRSIFGVMPDWNPAEIIGIRPKSLAMSLYKELITDETWAYQRDNYGYRNLRSHPLMISFLGIPYIDVRVSFNSFIPKKLDEATAEKLVDYYLEKLSQNNHYHDKIEFEIVFSCSYFGVLKHLEQLKVKGFDKSEIEAINDSLLEMTNKIINQDSGLYKKDIYKLQTLQKKYDDITNSELSMVDKIYWLIKDVKRYGTLPFAGIARAGFIAVQFLKSFVSEGIFTEDDYHAFLNSLNTVSKNLSCDLATMEKKEFLYIYGHLRPGTYDILSQRYDEAYDLYFSFRGHSCEKIENFRFTDLQKQKIGQMIKMTGLSSSYDELIFFIKEAIEAREYAKFVFTKSLSQVLYYVGDFGRKFGFSQEDLAYLDIQTIINLYATLDHRDVKNIIMADISKNKDFYRYTQTVKLPNLIIEPQDIYCFFHEDNEANFITMKTIQAQVVKEEDILKSEVEHKIVCIKSADPGYDYLFAKNIGGLITCYGGANSHMAIRCAENGIPAVIGCGENKFLKYIQAKFIEIDAAVKQVRIVS